MLFSEDLRPKWNPSYPFPQSKGDDKRTARSETELLWIKRKPFLESKGYTLRPRFDENWVPSWWMTGRKPVYCEDGASIVPLPDLSDAIRKSDGKFVMLKRVDRHEASIALFLNSPELRSDPKNHSIPIFDSFPDDCDPCKTYIVMPLCRDVDSPTFLRIQEIVDFLDQILEGLVFMHENGVAHRDGDIMNLAMDGSLFPEGFHPVHTYRLANGINWAPNISRRKARIRYYYLDFGLSLRFTPGEKPPLVCGGVGRDREAPEQAKEKAHLPHDSLKVDIFTFGNMLRRAFDEKYKNLGFLRPLIEATTRENPEARPTAQETYKMWVKIRRSLTVFRLYQIPLLREKSPKIQRFMAVANVIMVAKRIFKRTFCM